jgi:ATP-dependent RNA helicase DeaD
MVQSRTGSGKTGAFVLPLLEIVDPSVNACQALILTPTRELARQVATEAEMLSGPGGPRVVSVYGGVAYGPQIEGFKKGAHIVVGTPGRVLDHLLKRSLSLKDLRIFILDEADRMLSMGFYPDMKEIQSYLPKGLGNVQMFSATFPPYVIRLAEQFLTEPSVLSLSADHVHVTEIEHVYCVVPGMGRDRALVRLIEIENPSGAIIFCNTRNSVHFVTAVLQRFGYDADEISSDLAQGAREKVLGRIRAGTLRFLVATDVAARGIDIPELSHVIQYEPPEDPESYVHRAGRTGRAGASGEAITLVDSMEQIEITRIAKRFGIEFVERPVPTDEDVARIVSERVTALLEARLRARDTLEQERMQRFLPLARNLAESEDELRLLAMLLDDVYQRSLHEPQAHPVSGPVAGAPGSGSGRERKGGGASDGGGSDGGRTASGRGRGRGGRSRRKKG